MSTDNKNAPINTVPWNSNEKRLEGDLLGVQLSRPSSSRARYGFTIAAFSDGTLSYSVAPNDLGRFLTAYKDQRFYMFGAYYQYRRMAGAVNDSPTEELKRREQLGLLQHMFHNGQIRDLRALDLLVQFAERGDARTRDLLKLAETYAGDLRLGPFVHGALTDPKHDPPEHVAGPCATVVLAVARALIARAQPLIEAHAGDRFAPSTSPNHGTLGDVHVMRARHATRGNIVRIDPDKLRIVRQLCILRRQRLLSEIRSDERWARVFADGEGNVKFDAYGRPIPDDQLLDQALRSAVEDVREHSG